MINLFHQNSVHYHLSPLMMCINNVRVINIFFWQDEWLSQANTKDMYAALSNDVSLAKQIDSILSYARGVCPENSYDCLLSVAMGQNLFSTFTKLRIQNESVNGDIFKNSNSTYPEFSSGTYFCVSIHHFELLEK